MGANDFDIDLFEDGKTVVIPASETMPAERPSPNLWPPRLPLEIALCETYEEEVETAERFLLSEEKYRAISGMPAFRRAVAEMTITLRDEGYTFKQKCRAIAEDFLPSLDLALHDISVGFSTKLTAFSQLTRLGELEPKPKKEGPNPNNAPTVNIQINC